MIPEPIYSVTTERLYSRLPEVYRTLDSQNGWQFKTYISAIGDALNEIDLLAARIRYVPHEDRADYYATLDESNTYTRPVFSDDLRYEEQEKYDGFWTFDGKMFPVLPVGETSDLLDGRSADAEWLPFIGQLIGADLTALIASRDLRDAVVRNYLGFRAGSREALEDAAKSALTGTKYIRVYPHRDGAGGDYTHLGTQWDVLLITRPEETPGAGVVVNEIIRKGAKPAGVVLHHITYSIIWSNMESMFPTWTTIESEGYTWENIEQGNPDLLPV